MGEGGKECEARRRVSMEEEEGVHVRGKEDEEGG